MLIIATITGTLLLLLATVSWAGGTIGQGRALQLKGTAHGTRSKEIKSRNFVPQTRDQGRIHRVEKNVHYIYGAEYNKYLDHRSSYRYGDYRPWPTYYSYSVLRRCSPPHYSFMLSIGVR
jgi:hypothetical protein